MLGSTATFGAVDTLMTFARSGDLRTVSTIQRDGKDMPETVLTLDPETGWLTAAGPKREAQAADAAQSVYEFIRDAEAPMTMKEIVGAMETRATVTRDAVHHLADSGRIITTGRGVKNDPKRFSAGRVT